jgi:hypothetical protein
MERAVALPQLDLDFNDGCGPPGLGGGRDGGHV